MLAFLLSTLPCSGPVRADDEDTCSAGDQFAQADFALPHVAGAIRQKQLDIAVVGSGSSTLGGPGGSSKAYPARLEAALSQAFPEIVVKVLTYIKSRQTASDMVKLFDQVVADAKPALVVWQTGTVDAIQGVDVDDFRNVLEEGVEALRAKSVDVVFMNMQYSPRTEPVIAINNYSDAMRFVALQHEVLLFDRFAIMRHWSEVGTFDLFAATKKIDTAERVHDCLGRLLSRLIIEAEKMTETPGKEVR
jgi:hypothetical protein